MQLSLERHPSLRSSRAQEEAAAAETALARAGELPQLDASAELLRGTGNVLAGSLYPLRNVPPISGPPQPAQYGGAFGSAIGLGASWDVVGLLQRMSTVDASLREQERSGAATAARRLAVAYGAADAFIAILSARESVRTAQAGRERSRVFARQVQVLADKELRPGAEAARAQAEVALAQTQLARAEQAEALARAALAEALGAPGERFEVAPGPLAELPAKPVPGAAGRHPLEIEAAAATTAALARQRSVELQYLPRVDVVASLWLRGSGLGAGPVAPSPADGLAPTTPNWAVGAVASFPLLELYAARARERAAAARVEGSRAREDEVAQAVRGQVDAARAVLEGAERVAEQAPHAVEAARAAESQATARFGAGLGTVAEVAEAQRLLVQAEDEAAQARIAVWRARLLLARALGDLEPFLADARGPGGGS